MGYSDTFAVLGGMLMLAAAVHPVHPQGPGERRGRALNGKRCTQPAPGRAIALPAAAPCDCEIRHALSDNVTPPWAAFDGATETIANQNGFPCPHWSTCAANAI